LRVLQVNGAAGAGQDAPTGRIKFVGGDGILSLLSYKGRMFANSTTRTAIFYDGIELIRVPTNDPTLAIGMDKLPEGAFSLRCDVLAVSHRQEANADAAQQFQARGHAVVQSRKFSGRADTVKYDESKDLLVLEASEGDLATLVRPRGNGVAV